MAVTADHSFTSSALPVMEHFYTIQGEGAHQGKPAYFIRLGGCDVGCVWCDVRASWDASAHPVLTIDAIVDHVVNAGAELAVITGGEPCMYDLSELISALHANNIRVHIETSGAYPLIGNADWVCVSPKKFKAPLPEMLSRADELKVVIFNTSDFKWAEAHAEQVKDSCQLFIQPEWDKSAQVLPLMIDYVKQHKRWRIGLQVHKYMNIP